MVANDEARRLADEFEALNCYGDISMGEIEREQLEDWADKAYHLLWRLGQPESARKLGEDKE